jgi:dihydroneopterin aldolase/D-erythro-7,8-dihydroneopterin triphosphate epimerase
MAASIWYEGETMNRIYIRELALRCIIGVFPEEREKRQDVTINVVMDCDFSRAAETDRLEDTVDYKTIKLAIVSMVESSEFNLIETLADRVADICLADDKVKTVTVTVDKPGALRFARSVAVEVKKAKDEKPES